MLFNWRNWGSGKEKWCSLNPLLVFQVARVIMCLSYTGSKKSQVPWVRVSVGLTQWTRLVISRCLGSLRGQSCVALDKRKQRGTLLEVQWLELCASTAGGTVWSLVGKWRSCMQCSQRKKKERVKGRGIFCFRNFINVADLNVWSREKYTCREG